MASVQCVKVVGVSGLPVFSTRIIWAFTAAVDEEIVVDLEHDAPADHGDSATGSELRVRGCGETKYTWHAVSETWRIPAPSVSPLFASKVLADGLCLRCFVVIEKVAFSNEVACRLPRLKLPSASLSHSNARDTFGAVGITNQGATCYMSSLLQSLFHTRLFRAVVYHTPVSMSPAGGHGGGEAPAPSAGAAAGENALSPLPAELRVAGRSKVIHALQRVFAALEGVGDPSAGVSTVPLTNSFGWHGGEAQEQHDVQELMRVLLDHLEKKMAGTPLSKVQVPIYGLRVTCA